MGTDSITSLYMRAADYFLKFIAAVVVFLPVNIDCPLLFQTVLVLLYVAVLILALRKNVTMDWLSDALPPESAPARSHILTSWLFMGFVLLCAMLGFLEWRQPFYFTQDDSHSQFLPVIVNGMRGFFAEGVLPTWDAFLNLGHHTASVGVYTFTYPIAYIAYFIARFLLGNELYYIEVYAWLHFLAGYIILYLALREARVRPLIAVAGALCFVLCGFNLIAGRSWYIAVAYTAWLPALVWSVVAFEHSTTISRRWIWLTGLILGLSFHAGHAQLWFYGVIFWGVSIVWLLYCKPGWRWQGFFSTCSAGFMGLAIAAPLLIVQALEEIGLKNLQWNDGIGIGLNNILLPFPVVTSPHPNRDWGIHPDYMGALYYSGTTFFLLFLAKSVCEVVYVIRHSNIRAARLFDLTTLTFVMPLIVAFWWSLGQQGRLWAWLAQIPPINNMNSPFKFLPFIALYSVMVGAPFLERLVRRFAMPVYSQCMIAGITIGLLCVNGVSGKYPWMDFRDIPYPELPEVMKKLQLPHDFTSTAVRIIPYTPWRSQTPNYTITLPHNYPSYYRILSTDGYNLGVTGTREHKQVSQWRGHYYDRYLNEYGIRGAIFAHQLAFESLSDVKMEELKRLVKLVKEPVIINAEQDKYYPVKSDHIKPIVYTRNGEGVASLPFRVRPNGIAIRVPDNFQKEKYIMANFIYRPWFRATGSDGTALPIKASSWGRILINNVTHSGYITLSYLPPWRAAILIGLGLAVLSWGTWRMARRDLSNPA